MPGTPPSMLLVNPETMGSMVLDNEAMHLIILGLVGFAHEVEGSDKQLASDLADKVHQHMKGRPLTAGAFDVIRTISDKAFNR